MRARQSTGVGLHTILDVVLISLGLMLAFKWIQLPTVPVVFPILVSLLAAVAVAMNDPIVRRVALGIMLFCLYMILRSTGVIELPWIQYGVAGLLIVVGVMSVMRDLTAQHIADSKLASNRQKEVLHGRQDSNSK